MRIRIFGKIRYVGKAFAVAAVLLLAGAVAAAGYFLCRDSELPEVTGASLSEIESGVPADNKNITVTPSLSDPTGSPDDAAFYVYDPGGAGDVSRDSVETDEELLAVHISGAVQNEGVYRLPPGSIVQDAVDMCGGLAEDADTYYVNLAMRIADGMRIHIPRRCDENKTWLLDAGSVKAESKAAVNASGDTLLVNINTAGLSELMALSGVGESTARDIIAYREEHGRFASIEEIMNVPGIKEAKYAKIRKNITV